MAASLGSAEAMRQLPPEDRRLAPGYPALIRLAASVLPLPVAALAVAVAGAVVATFLLGLLVGDRWPATWFAVLTPSWIAFTSTAMSEGPFLAFALAGLLLWRRGAAIGAGWLFGASAVIRPVGGVLFLAVWLVARSRAGFRTKLAALAVFAILPVTWALVSAAVWGRPEAQVEAYLHKDLAWPGTSLAAGLARPMGDPLKLSQDLVILAVVLAAGVALWRRWRRGRHVDHGEWLAWLGAQLGFYLVLPSSWVFECLPRFLVTCLPAVAVALGGRLPRRVWMVAALAALGVAISLWWNLRALGLR